MRRHLPVTDRDGELGWVVEYDIAAPDPAGMTASLSSLGYSLPASVADLVDNSVSAGARHIDVHFTWRGGDSWVAVVDDGRGMSPEELLTAMTVAGRGVTAPRSASDLGRFGVGLKSASFAQARQLTVSSVVAGRRHTRTWDLDLIERCGEWRLLSGEDDETGSLIRELGGGVSRGTVVLWRRLNGYHDRGVAEGNRRIQRQFQEEAARTRAHLAMVFSRFLSGRGQRVLRVGAEKIVPWDPFLGDHPSVHRLPVEELVHGGGRVTVEAFVLPGPGRLSQEEYQSAGGPAGWLDQQGFYVYRRDRLILAGSWLGLSKLRREEKFNLTRIAVDIPAEADVHWGVDVRKSRVTPPVALRDPLRRIAEQAREQAVGVTRSRGRFIRTPDDPLVHVWNVRRRVGGEVTCHVNRDHPLVRAALRPEGAAPSDVRALLRLLEETVPTSSLRVMREVDGRETAEPFGGGVEADEDAVAVAERIHASLVAEGRTPEAACERLRSMPPFDRQRGFWSA